MVVEAEPDPLLGRRRGASAPSRAWMSRDLGRRRRRAHPAHDEPVGSEPSCGRRESSDVGLDRDEWCVEPAGIQLHLVQPAAHLDDVVAVEVERLDAVVSHRGDRPKRRLEVLRAGASARSRASARCAPSGGHPTRAGVGGRGNGVRAIRHRVPLGSVAWTGRGPPDPVTGALFHERGGACRRRRSDRCSPVPSRPPCEDPTSRIGHRGQQQPRVVVQRPVQDVVRRALLDDPAGRPSRGPRRRRSARSRDRG